MDLFLFRHAVAAPADPAESEALGATTADARRPLTDLGRQKFARSVRALDEAGVRFDHLVYSPWRRAAETADLLRPLLRGTSVASASLTASPTVTILPELHGERVGVVGHQPWLGELVGILARMPADAIEWKKGGLVWLVGTPTPGGMRIRAIAPRRLLGG